MRLSEARQRVVLARADLAQAADASNRAVMAEQARGPSEQAKQAGAELERELGELGVLLRGLSYDDEARLLDEVSEAYARLRALDDEVLALALENTNRQAQQLASTELPVVVQQLEDALDAAAPDLELARHVRAQNVLLAVRELQVLEPPHIAELDESKMGLLEQHMTLLEARARGELDALGDPRRELALEAAADALGRFLALHARVIALSRRNSNVLSLAMSLGEKRALTDECDRLLRQLADRLLARTFPATR